MREKQNFLFGCVCIGLATLIFSTMEVILKLPAVEGAFHPMQITLGRFLIGGLFLLPVAAWALHRKQRKLTAKDLGAFAITGLFCVPLAMVFYQLALVSGHANVVAVIFSGNPIFVTILAFLLLRESIRWNNILALVLEVLGILAIAVLGGGGGSLLSVVLAILAALFFALYAVLGKRETAQVGTIVVTCGSFLFGSVELLVLLLLGHTGAVSSFYGAVGLDMFQDVPLLLGINLQSLPYLLFIGIVSTGLGYVFHMFAIEKTSATHGSLVFFFKPILAPLVALAVLGEAITGPMVLGIVFFLAGSLMGILPEFLRNRRKAAPLPQHEGECPPMFPPIAPTPWPRREHFHYYRNILPCGYSVTVQLDVTKFRAMCRNNGLKFYPSFIWCVSHNILAHPAFRMGVDGAGNPGYHDMLHPNYTVFHEDDHTFSDLWTAHDEDFAAFYQAFLADVAQYGGNHGIKARPGQPANFYCISCVPWLDFTGYASMAVGGQPNLFPVITYGKATEHDGRETLPFAVNISHAAADGWHTSQFLNDLQALLDSADLHKEGAV